MMVFLALGIYMVLFNLQKWNNQLVEQLDEYEDKPSVDAPWTLVDLVGFSIYELLMVATFFNLFQKGN